MNGDHDPAGTVLNAVVPYLAKYTFPDGSTETWNLFALESAINISHPYNLFTMASA